MTDITTYGLLQTIGNLLIAGWLLYSARKRSKKDRHSALLRRVTA